MGSISLYIISVLLGIIGGLLGRLLWKFDDLIKGFNKINEVLVAHQTRIDNMDIRFNNDERRTDNHAERIRKLELNQASCKNFDHAN